MTILEMADALRAKKISSLELTNETLEKIARENPRLNAFITVTADAARARASAMDAELSHRIDRGPLHGVPFAHKDLVYTKGIRTTGGSKIFKDFVPDHDARLTFDAMPDAIRERVYRRLYDVLTNKDQSKTFARLSGDDRRAIFEILIATKPNLPDYWKGSLAG